VVHSRRIEHEGRERTLRFGHAGVLYKKSFVMYDRETGSKWNHSTGLCMKGPLVGTQLELLPTRVTLWERWKSQYPETRVLLGHRSKGMIGQFMREAPHAYGIAVGFGPKSRLYRYRALREEPVLNDAFEGRTDVIVFDPTASIAFAFDRRVDDRKLHFEVTDAEDGQALRMQDRETGSVWDRMRGGCLSGPLKGRSLRQVISVPWLVERWRQIYGEAGSLYGG